MLGKSRRIWFTFSEIALMVLFGAVALLGHGLISSNEVSYASNLYFDIRAALLFSLSFMVLSGFFISVIIVSSFLHSARSWKRRAIIDSVLFIVHTVLFVTFFGNDYSISDLPLMVLGIIVVVLSEATAGWLWRGRLEEASPSV